jgi:hypothetical protein
MINNIESALSIYCCAVENELRRDVFMHEKFGLKKYGSIILPRAEKIYKWVHMFPRTTIVIASMLQKVWSFLFFPFFISVVSLKTLFDSKGKNWEEGIDDLFLSTSIIGLEAVNKVGFDGYVLFIIRSQYYEQPNLNKHLLLTDYCTFSDIKDAFILSIMANKAVKNSIGINGAILQTYTAFNWFLVWAFFERMTNKPKKLWFANDSDRWAVLFDNLTGLTARILVQHGLLADYFEHEVNDRPSTPLLCKLQNVTKIFAYDDLSESLFEKLILAEKSHVEYEKFPMSLSLVKWPKNRDIPFSVIIIGQPETAIKECRLAKEIINFNKQWHVILKSHPSYSSKPYKYIKSNRFHLLDKKNIFPFSNIALMFADSSLGCFYEAEGIEIISINNYENDEVIKLIEMKYNSIF